MDFLENLSEREQLFNFFEVNQTAIRAQNIAQESLDMVSRGLLCRSLTF